MRVLFVSDSPTLSGAEVVLLQHVRHLQRTGSTPHVVLRSTNLRLRQALSELGVGHTPTAAFADRIIETTANPLSLAHFALAFARMRRVLAAEIGSGPVDLLHSVSYPASLYAAFACRTTGRRQIWHEHNIKRLHRFNRPIYRFVAATCAAVIGPSDAVTGNLRRAGLGRVPVETLYNGIDLARFEATRQGRARVRRELGLDDTVPAVALFGQMLPHKGHGTVLAALPAVRRAVPAVRAFFVGALENPPYEAALRHQMAEARLDDIVSFTGWRSDVHDVMAAMDVNIVATTTPEPAALALMESMAVGSPVVATRTGGTAEIVRDGETGLLFEPGDAVGLGDSLVALLGDPERRAAFGRAGRARVEGHFSEARHLAALDRLYQRALTQR